ncbi:uncharacterized protein C8A04DRAFT_24970 [Dichotomopilus funicola]|uniref:Uncharacterized protein n=1 Tax=Dichotomopilus funicola TaxID=1934379 RepID=A0AAN6ZQJ5_9PEZI|nr:hypothetical protein C8A04DRAFT_24970 [Dichotomopilus funicola]
MVRYAIVAFAGLAAALPLNINLGAYSPALVVGDGEISFGGRQDVSNLITALEGAAVNAAAGAANNNNNAAAAGANAAAAAADTNAGAGTGAGQGAPTIVDTNNNGVAAPTPVIEGAATNAAADPALAEQAQQIAGLQGLGKAIAPRIDNTAGTEAAAKQKRDLAGFDRALTFAEAALVKGPKVELGTGAEGSGVGIIVDHSTAGEGARVAKRSTTTATTTPRRRAKVTTMFVRRGVPASLNSHSEAAAAAAAAAVLAARSPSSSPEDNNAPFVTRSTPATATTMEKAKAKRDVASGSAGGAFDEVNLNVDGDAGVTMTFVESFEDDNQGDQADGVDEVDVEE